MKTLTSALAPTVVTLAPVSAYATTYPGVEQNCEIHGPLLLRCQRSNQFVGGHD